jgi:hypothetical protein
VKSLIQISTYRSFEKSCPTVPSDWVIPVQFVVAMPL